jgi:hypothetical protein
LERATPTQGERVLAEAAEAFRVALGDRLLAAYALGSLAHGGFSELVSDIDLGLIVSDPLRPADDETIEAIARTEKRKRSALHERLSVFWGTPTTLRGEQKGGRFPALDRLDLIENGRLLIGDDSARSRLPRPSAAALLIAGAEFALDYLSGVPRPGRLSSEELGSMRVAGEDASREILFPGLLLGHGMRRTTKLVLFPVRFLYTAATGRVGTNDSAVSRYLEDEQAPGRRLVAAALRWRTVPPTDESAASELLREQLLPLYLHYIDDHVERLDLLGKTELAGSFREWRNRLLSAGTETERPP